MRAATLLWASCLLACSSSSPSSPIPQGASIDGSTTPADAATAGDDGSSPDAALPAEGGAPVEAGAEGGAADGGAVSLGKPSQSVVDDAIAAALSSYHRNASTGDIWCLPCDGAPVMLATAAYVGNTSADARLLQQMRTVLGGGNDPFGTGGYAANDERNITAMYAIAKRVPRVWNQLSASEVHLVDTIMEATLVASVYTTADKTNASGAPLGFAGNNADGGNRDFNPNYREGMIGAVLVGTEYFGGQQATETMLNAYDHAAFTASLQTLGLTNLYWTFGTYARDPAASAPSPQTVQAGVTGYAMHGITLGQLLDLYVNLASDTFGAKVSCGLNGGAGIDVNGVYAGRVISGCSSLPNVGSVGEEKEFDSVDANGPRSDASYARLGLRDNLFNQLVLFVYGGWMDTSASTPALHQVAVGVGDFFYKVNLGYQSYSHGTNMGLFNCGNMDCALNQAVWSEVLAPAHGL